MLLKDMTSDHRCTYHYGGYRCGKDDNVTCIDGDWSKCPLDKNPQSLASVYNDIRDIVNEWGRAEESIIAGHNPNVYLKRIKIIIDRYEED